MIYDADDLNEVRDYVGVVNIYFQLANDIDLSTYSNGLGWEPIGTSGAQFKGVFDGNGHTIYNLKINRTTDYVGLFGYNSGIIKSVCIECVIKGKSYVGGVTGYSSSTISNCYVKGSIIASSYCGGIVGYVYNSTISNFYFNGNIVSSSNYCGGIIG